MATEALRDWTMVASLQTSFCRSFLTAGAWLGRATTASIKNGMASDTLTGAAVRNRSHEAGDEACVPVELEVGFGDVETGVGINWIVLQDEQGIGDAILVLPNAVVRQRPVMVRLDVVRAAVNRLRQVGYGRLVILQVHVNATPVSICRVRVLHTHVVSDKGHQGTV